MALKTHSLLLRSFLFVSITLNILFLLRFFSAPLTPTSQIPTHRFHHRALPLRESNEEGAPATSPSTEQPGVEVPIYDGSREAAKPFRGFPPGARKADEERIFDSPQVAIRTSHRTHHGEFKNDEESWTVYEDLAKRDGAIVFQSTKTKEQRVLIKTGEAAFYKANPAYPKYGSISMAKIGMSAGDLLADHLLRNGEPAEAHVKAIIPPMGSKAKSSKPEFYTPPEWTSFVGTVEANDNVAVYGYGNTKSYQALQQAPDITNYSRTRFEGLVGGWMPAVRKVLTEDVDEDPPEDYYETIVFGDVDAKDPFIVQTWHRTIHVTNNTIVKTLYAHSYPSFPKNKTAPSAEEFYRAFFRFGEYWQARLADVAQVTLPDQSWIDMPKYAFAKELMVRPGGSYPKYGAIDRDYYGSEYDGFQDVFTSSVSANLEWGRFAHAWNVIDNYFTLFVGTDGSINMRGPEIGQFGLTLSLLAKYSHYTGETDLLWKHKEKIVATADLLIGLHNESLELSPASPGYGLIHGWSESDACLSSKPDTYWQPYFANSALAARGLRDISTITTVFGEYSPEWKRRAQQLTNRTIESVTKSIHLNKKPLYVPVLPGSNLTFRESMAKENPSPQAWPHRLYAELLHAAILPANLTNLVHDTMRAYGATSAGVVANVAAPSRQGRDILGFVSYGHALSLLLADRIDEFVLFLYTHRYHVHTRGAWNAGEVTDIVGGGAIFCIPAQLTIPSIVRWALVLEHPDDDLLYLGRGIPRAWLASGKEIGINQAPTRWGRVDFVMQYANSTRLRRGEPKVRAQVKFTKDSPKEVQIKFRLPKGQSLTSAKVNGQAAELKGENVVIRLWVKETTLLIEGF